MKDLCGIKDFVREIHRLETQLKDVYDLTLNEGLCLCCITKVGNTPGECATQLGVSASRVSRILNSLEKKGLLARRFSNADKRSTTLAITRKGREKLERLRCDGFRFSKLDALEDLEQARGEAFPAPEPGLEGSAGV